MNARPFTLTIEYIPVQAAAVAPASRVPPSITGRCRSFWLRPRWLHPDFWEVRQPHPRGAPAENGALEAGCQPGVLTSIWVGLGTAGLGWTVQVSGQTRIPPGTTPLDERLVFPITDGQINLPPFHIRLPPGLTFSLTQAPQNRLHLHLAHPALGPICSADLQPTVQKNEKELLPC